MSRKWKFFFFFVLLSCCLLSGKRNFYKNVLPFSVSSLSASFYFIKTKKSIVMKTEKYLWIFAIATTNKKKKLFFCYSMPFVHNQCCCIVVVKALLKPTAKGTVWKAYIRTIDWINECVALGWMDGWMGELMLAWLVTWVWIEGHTTNRYYFVVVVDVVVSNKLWQKWKYFLRHQNNEIS